ncbi:MAG: hypothetical protein M1827_004885 [Pycnora praestabilis]|nr:MAG: hypothetical protein M1827_004885 [Pycnora praestabilis]
MESIYQSNFQLAAFLAILSLGYVTAVATYRLTLHPLAKYPGPLLGKITEAYSVYQAWTGRRHINFWDLHQQYGDIVRFGPNDISINSNTALPQLYLDKKNTKKSKFYTIFPGQANIFNITDRQLHGRKKKVLAQAFSEQALRGLQPYAVEEISTFTERIMTYSSEGDKEWSTAMNMGKWTNYMTYDVLGSICYGKSFRTLVEDSNRYIVELINGVTAPNYIFGQMPSLKKLGLTNPMFTGCLGQVIRFVKYGNAQFKEREKAGIDTERRDFFYYLFTAKDPDTGEGLKSADLMEQSRGFLIAGADTTSVALSSCFFYLLHNPATLSKLISEIRFKFSNVEDIYPGPELLSCLYLQACVDEAMRLSPPVPTGPPREILTGGITIDDVHYPEGTVLSVPTYTIQRTEKYFTDAEAFQPERWIVESANDEDEKSPKAEAIALAKSAYYPFSLGPRKCLGQRMALMQISVALARTVWLYDMRLAPDKPHLEKAQKKDQRFTASSQISSKTEPEYPLVDYLICIKDGPMVQFKPKAVQA